MGVRLEDSSAGSRRNLLAPCVFATAAALLAMARPTAGLELDDYISEVVHFNPVVREQVHEYRQIFQDYEIARSGWRPSLDFEATAGRTSREAPSTNQSRNDFTSGEASLTLTQNLFRGFETTHEVEQARARIGSAGYRLYDTADNVALEAIQAYLQVVEERHLAELALANVESHERILAKIQERNFSGIGLRSEVEQTEGRVARAHASLIAQQNNLRDAQTGLHEFIGRHVDPYDLVEPAELSNPAEVGYGPLLDQALSGHPAIRSAQLNIEASHSDYRRSRSTNFPSLDLQVQQSYEHDTGGISGNTDERSVLLTLRYNLFRGGADQAEQRKRVSVLHEDKAFLDRVRRQVMDTLSLSWAADRAVREQLPYLRTHVEKARQTLESYLEEFVLNQRDLIDLLDAEAELNTARIRLTEARFQAYAARYRVYEGIGSLLPALGIAVDIQDDDLIIASLHAKGIDAESIDADRDGDSLPDNADQCDNSAVSVVIDKHGCASQPEFEIGYPGMGSAPEGVDDQLNLRFEENTPMVIPTAALLANDRDADNDELALLGYTQPKYGEISTDYDGNLVYQPNADSPGRDEFTYSVGDGRSRSDTAVVTIQVQAIDPTADVITLQFGYKSTALTEQSMVQLENIVARLLQNPDEGVDVYTYTDNIGSAAYNLRLSKRRARDIAQLFIDRGVEASRVKADGRGENSPIADNSTDEGRARNRRAEVQFTTM